MDESVQKYLKPLDQASLLLLATANEIEKNGLSCGGVHDEFGRECTARVMNRLERDFGIVLRAARRIENAIGRPGLGLGHWSDSTPADQVIAKLRAVALGG